MSKSCKGCEERDFPACFSYCKDYAERKAISDKKKQYLNPSEADQYSINGARKTAGRNSKKRK